MDPLALIFFSPFVLVGSLALAVAVYTWRRAQQRREALALWAAREGLSFSIQDPHGLDRLDLHLFAKGDGRGVENVATGTWQGLDVRVADYWYYERSSNGKGGSSKTTYRFSIVLARVDASFPGVRITKENLFSRFADHVALRDLELESEEFNRRFEVGADDREFAYKLLDARMMEWLLHTEGPHCFEVGGPWVLCYCKQLAASETPQLLGAVKGFMGQIPRLVWADYGRATP